MIRRKQIEEPENHERWVISYADFITLLFAFFVVMYSISSVNEGKYKVLSDTLVSVFNAKSGGIKPIQVSNEKSGSSTVKRMVPLPVPGDYPAQEDYKYTVEGLFDDVQDPAVKDGPEEGEVNELGKISDEIAVAFQGLISDDLANIRTTKDWIEVDIQSKVLFTSGSARLSSQAQDILGKVAGVLASYENPIKVEGYTDNVPIQTYQFPSNWELSASRSAAVVRLLASQKINPDRLVAVGYGEYHPLVENDTEENRAKNRRVSLIISKAQSQKESKLNDTSDFKVGAGVTDEVKPLGSDPESRQQAARKSSTKVPLKIIKMENGGLLFSSDPAPTQSPSEQQSSEAEQ